VLSNLSLLLTEKNKPKRKQGKERAKWLTIKKSKRQISIKQTRKEKGNAL
jgi:hypothetical protein